MTSNCFQKLPYICEIELEKEVIPHPSNGIKWINAKIF